MDGPRCAAAGAGRGPVARLARRAWRGLRRLGRRFWEDHRYWDVGHGGGCNCDACEDERNRRTAR